MSIGPWQVALIVLLIVLLFGRGKISEMMGDFGKGIKSFKQGLNDDEGKPSTPSGHIEGPGTEAPSTDSAKQADTTDQAR